MAAYIFRDVTAATLQGNNIELHTADIILLVFVCPIWFLEYPKHAQFHAKGSVKCFGLVDLKRNENGEICYNNSYCV